jgi:C_GCAxxG_C_C family probable redox protein
MKDRESLKEIMTAAYRRMHRYTCAEASLQALLEILEVPLKGNSWATAGYSGAILSGKTTCGLLIGSSNAIGLYFGLGKDERPEEDSDARGKAIQAVNELYKAFLEKFESSDCKTLVKLDFQNGDQVANWMQTKGWKKTCDVYMDFVINKCLSIMEKEEQRAGEK